MILHATMLVRGESHFTTTTTSAQTHNITSQLKAISVHRAPATQQQHTDSQQQLPGQSMQDSSKLASADTSTAPSTQHAPSRQQSSLQLQAKTAGPPYRKHDNALNQSSHTAGQEQHPRPWYQIGRSAVVKEAIKVGYGMRTCTASSAVQAANSISSSCLQKRLF